MLNLPERVKILVIVFLLITTTVHVIVFAFSGSMSRQDKLAFTVFDGMQLVMFCIWFGSGILALVGAMKKTKYHLIPLAFVLYANLILNILFFCYLLKETWNFPESELLNGYYWKVIFGFGAIFSSSGLSVYTIWSIYQFYGQLA